MLAFIGNWGQFENVTTDPELPFSDFTGFRGLIHPSEEDDSACENSCTMSPFLKSEKIPLEPALQTCLM